MMETLEPAKRLGTALQRPGKEACKEEAGGGCAPFCHMLRINNNLPLRSSYVWPWGECSGVENPFHWQLVDQDIVNRRKASTAALEDSAELWKAKAGSGLGSGVIYDVRKSLFEDRWMGQNIFFV